ncbi:DUF4236 domain-containing protein [Acidocella sp.]|uniref:DUF4236 domain-containing protein n=1 Tax=Acidocella sp. TaxID=50710 RepID=UPI00261E741E|nr:DUF4236 domain-containing protein [Acidocella sp.]
MGLRFRRRIRLAKGLYVNLSKSGSSLSIGGHGATVNIGKHGVRETVGLPGTGLSYSHTIGAGQHQGQAEGAPVQPRQGGGGRPLLTLLGLVALVIVVVGFVSALTR